MEMGGDVHTWASPPYLQNVFFARCTTTIKRAYAYVIFLLTLTFLCVMLMLNKLRRVCLMFLIEVSFPDAHDVCYVGGYDRKRRSWKLSFLSDAKVYKTYSSAYAAYRSVSSFYFCAHVSIVRL